MSACGVCPQRPPLRVTPSCASRSNRYTVHAQVAASTAAAVARTRAHHMIKVYGGACPHPIIDFAHLPLHKTVARRLDEQVCAQARARLHGSSA